jgi:hypothetical protein
MKYETIIKRVGECLAPWAKVAFYLVRLCREFYD